MRLDLVEEEIYKTEHGQKLHEEIIRDYSLYSSEISSKLK